jgi:hypothetical protein
MTKNALAYPPGPRGPEDDTPGPHIGMSLEQARFVGHYIDTIDGARSVAIEERGDAYLEVTLFDRDGQEIERRTVFPIENRL